MTVDLPNLKIGDTLPNFIIDKVINNENQDIRSSNYHDKLLLIDFWSIYCSGCVAAFPKLDTLQKLFSKDLRILLVTKDRRKDVEAFWDRSKYTKGLMLPSVIEDTLLSNYFKYRAMPHEVWVFKGKIVGITNPEYVDAENVGKVLNGNIMKWPVKNDFYFFNAKLPLFPFNSRVTIGNTSKFEYVAISGYKEGVNSYGLSGGIGIDRDSTNRIVRTYVLNSSLFTAVELITANSGIFKKLVKPSFMIQPNQLIWNVSDKRKYKYFNKKISGYSQDWIRLHGFCFESQHTDMGEANDEVYMRSLKEIGVMLGLEIGWKKVFEKVYVLSKDKFVLPKKILKEGTLSSNLVSKLNEVAGGPYIFDDTGGDVILSPDLMDISDFTRLNIALKIYSLHLDERLQNVDKLIFSEIGNNKRH